jgi:signal transduction histidine kinase/CheY-like chemotaxis protein
LPNEGCSTINLNEAHEPYLLLSDQLTIQDFSPSVLELTQLPPDDIAGRQLLALFTVRGPGTAALSLDRLRTELLQGLELELNRRDSTGLVLRAAAIPVHNGARAYLVHLQDRTREIRTKEELFHLSRLTTVGRLFSGMVHEINNTLSGIVGYAQLLLLEERAPEIETDLKRIFDEAMRTSQIVENVLSFLRLRAMKPSELKLGEVIERALRLRHHALRMANVRVRTRIPATLPAVAGDETLLRQVFVNVITNAEKSIATTKRGGTISIHARTSPGQIRIVVTDDGPGIPPGLEDKIFMPFFSTRGEGDGCGLGLSICRDILDLHGASIQLHPRRGAGASFVLTFPSAPARSRIARSAPTPSAADTKRATGLHVVVIDDEPSVREVVARAFDAPGNEIVMFERGDSALDHVLSHPVDLIVSDVHRPGFNGVDFFQALRTRAPSLCAKVVFVTGDLVSQDVAAFLRTNAPRHLKKPFRVADLLEVARTVRAPDRMVARAI